MSGDRNAERDALRRARQLRKELSEPVDEQFKRSLADLSRGLGERLASRPDALAAAEKRRAALADHDRERSQRLRSVLVTTGGGVLSGCIAWAVVMLAQPVDEVPLPAAAAHELRAPVEAAVVAASPPPPVEVAATGPVSIPSATRPPAAVAEPSPPPLSRDEVRELQTRLRGFGFKPGPIDGAAGPMTLAAATRYREDRGLGRAEVIDRDLLDDLRADPAPRIVVARAAPAPRPARDRPAQPRQAMRGDGFDGLRVAMQDLERWFQSMGR